MTVRYYVTCNEAMKLINREADGKAITKNDLETLIRHFCTCIGCMNYYNRKVRLKDVSDK